MKLRLARKKCVVAKGGKAFELATAVHFCGIERSKQKDHL